MTHSEYTNRPVVHIGMSHKPLQKYSPGAQRSRLDYIRWRTHKKNEGSLKIGNSTQMPDSLHFRSTAQILMKQLPKQLDVFPGTASEKLKWLRHQQWL
jgi:hypothetical protein